MVEFSRWWNVNMTPEFLNLYIERLLQEITELTKNRLLLETQLKYTEQFNTDLTNQITILNTKLEKPIEEKSKK
jgi:hypothetical protein